MSTSDTPTECPECKADLKGPEIPADIRHLYGGYANYSRVINVYVRDLDRGVAWRCPDCGHAWQR